MRSQVTQLKLEAFMKELARNCQTPGNVYFTGGSTALLLGIRGQTIDLDVRFDPEPKGAFASLAKIKNELDVNIELAAPSDFIPVSVNWRERSQFIQKVGPVTFYHFDLVAQALSKIERGYAQDITDASAFLAKVGITPGQLWDYFESIQADMMRYPALNGDIFAQKVRNFIHSWN